VGAASKRVTSIPSTGILVVTVYRGSGAANLWITLVDGALVIVITIGGYIVGGIGTAIARGAGIVGAQVIVVAIFGLEDTANLYVAGILGTLGFIVADLGGILTASGRVAGVIRASVLIITIPFLKETSYAWITFINGAFIVIIARDLGIFATPSLLACICGTVIAIVTLQVHILATLKGIAAVRCTITAIITRNRCVDTP